MKDAVGQELHEGDMVFVQLSTPVIRCKVTKVADGGRIRIPIPGNPTQASGVKPDMLGLMFAFEDQLLDAQPGMPHPMVHRIPDPEIEEIVKKGN